MKIRRQIFSIIIIVIAVSGCASYSKLSGISDDYDSVQDFFAAEEIPVFEAESRGIYFDGRQWYERSLELIESAEDYILINSFLTTEHDHCREIYRALKRKMDEGVRVYCIFDSASSYRTYPRSTDVIRAAIPYVRELGIPYTEYSPIRGRRVPTLLGLFDRDHRKFWIVDGKVVVEGGQNIDYDSLSFPEDGGCIDTMVEIESEQYVSMMQDAFFTSWNRYSVAKLNKEDFRIRAAEKGAPVWVFNQDRGDASTVTAMFDGLFTYAEDELWLVQCYTYVTPSLLDKIKFAVDRGVKVNFIISENQIGERFEKAALYSIKTLLKTGANVYLFNSPYKALLHYKLILADGRYASIGSANYNFRSQSLSRELSIISEDPVLVETVSNNLDQLMLNCRQVYLEEAEEYQGMKYLLNYILMQFWG